ncbi:MAG: hypothetical protein IGBAC_0578 [Ignavibacteriae bacterium]|nr:MAG: hypothetical protein IGBAC_0578 [Ignavibacteriota bacterium]
MNRRNFSKLIGATAFLPAFIQPPFNLLKLDAKQTNGEIKFLPDELYGRKLSAEEKIWLENFYKNYEKSKAELQNIELPIELLPAFIPKYPMKSSRTKKQTDED